MKCPVCPDESLSISSREGVEIDFCPQCRGVWLDRGELDKIIERAQPGGGAAEPRREERRYEERGRYGDERRDYDVRYDKRRKKRSFLEDIFDFD